ncbi:MAG TPA: class I SAM-dependent methyltransferase [Planctomycetes bacterium]|nr:class I SAM-dependent methyltransferase [Planctomycetota bacterium]
MSSVDKKPTDELHDKEARFWDLQEERIDDLYARPHDWRFIPKIADKVIKPKIRYLQRLISRHKKEIGSILDIGCGNGWFCHACAEAGIRAYGVDISPKKVETAQRIAEEKGIADLCHFEAKDVMEVELPEKVDMLSAHGSLHHFPDLENQLPEMVERFLSPDGYMLFVEPHHEGMPPNIQDFIFKAASSKLFGRFFDKEFYLEVTGRSSLDEPEPEAPTEGDFNIRGESPAGLEFLGEEPDMGKILKDRYTIIEEKYFHYASGHLTNAFYVYQKSKLTRGLWRLLLPWIIWWDDRRCDKAEYNKYAEEGLWFLKR